MKKIVLAMSLLAAVLGSCLADTTLPVDITYAAAIADTESYAEACTVFSNAVSVQVSKVAATNPRSVAIKIAQKYPADIEDLVVMTAAIMPRADIISECQLRTISAKELGTLDAAAQFTYDKYVETGKSRLLIIAMSSWRQTGGKTSEQMNGYLSTYFSNAKVVRTREVEALAQAWDRSIASIDESIAFYQQILKITENNPQTARGIGYVQDQLATLSN